MLAYFCIGSNPYTKCDYLPKCDSKGLSVWQRVSPCLRIPPSRKETRHIGGAAKGVEMETEREEHQRLMTLWATRKATKRQLLRCMELDRKFANEAESFRVSAKKPFGVNTNKVPA